MFRGGGARRPSQTSASSSSSRPSSSQMDHHQPQHNHNSYSFNISASSSSSSSPTANFNLAQTPTTATPSHNGALLQTAPPPPPPPPPPASISASSHSPSSIPSSLVQYVSQSQPSTPVASTDAPLPSHSSSSTARTQSHSRPWGASNHPSLLTTRSVGEGSEYPFPLSPSDPNTPLHRRPTEYTASTVSASSAPVRSPHIFHTIGSKLPTSPSSSQHNKKPTNRRSSLGKVKAILRLPFLTRRETSPPSSRDQSSSSAATPTTPIDTYTPADTERPPPPPPLLTTSLQSGPSKEGSGADNSPNEMPESPSTIGLLERRRNRNGPNNNGEPMPPDTLLQNLSQPEKPRSILSPAAPVMLTPPEDDRKQPLTWQNLSSSSQPTHQAEYSSPTNILSEQSLIVAMQSGTEGSESRGSSAPKLSPVTEQMHATDILASVLSNGLQTGEEWLKEALKVMLILNPPHLRPATEAVRLISHSLPCPLPSNRTPGESSYSAQSDSGYLPESASAAQGVAAAAGYFMLPFDQCKINSGLQNAEDDGTTSALNTITSAIQKVHGDDTKRVYIHVSHAISSNITASKIQSSNLTGSSVNSTATSAGSFVPSAFMTSPPHERDFFSSTIFNSIVMAQDPISYSSPPTFPAPLLQRPSPNPALPPFSLHFSLLERYIPPATPTADSAMFSPYSSVLLDRVVELSPNGGSLLFIYPTKTGARQFLDRYLGKVLDPLLRRLMVLHRLRDDLLWGISRMVAVEQMQEFEDLKGRLEHFCRRLCERSRDETTDEKRFAGPNLFSPNVTLVHAQKVNVSLSQSSWREWWTIQESARIREVVKNHFSSATVSQETGSVSQAVIHDSPTIGSETASMGPPGLATAVQYSGPMDLAREILDGVKVFTMRPSSRGMGEAVLASSMVGPTPSWPVVGEVGSPTHSRRKPERETIEVGVFVLRRHA